MDTAEKLALINAYYDGCSSGDVDVMVTTLTDDVVHYFLAPNPGSKPVRGGEYLARYWRKAQARINGRWVVDSIVGDGDRAVIEWTLFWTPPGTDRRVATRGAEAYVFRDGRIAEIRAYYQQRADASTELEDFDYDGAGFSRLGHESSALHPAAGQEAA